MNIRPSPIAGSWYPQEPAALKRMLTQFLENAQSLKIDGKIWGVVVPHASYQYSGRVAANAFNVLWGHHPALVVLLSPFHDYHQDPFLTSTHHAYHTPLGPVEIHREILNVLDQKLRDNLRIGLTPLSHDSEPSIEIQLPFLQAVLGDFRFLPIMLRSQNAQTIRVFGQVLGQILRGKNVLFVASSDLSHFHPQDRARDLDAETLHRIEALDAEGILMAETRGVGYACGAAAIAASFWGMQEMGADRVTVTGYATSGDVNGDYNRVVGYGSAVVWQQEKGR